MTVEFLLQEAIDFATKAHEGQFRKLDANEPYIEHPKRVMKIVKTYSDSLALWIAALSHDIAEDTQYTLEDIRERFGEEVADLVASNTEDKSLSWEDRKFHTINSIQDLNIDKALLLGGDKFDNVSSLLNAIKLIGEEAVWRRFKGTKEKQAWYYTLVASYLLEKFPKHPLFVELFNKTKELFGDISGLVIEDWEYVHIYEWYDGPLLSLTHNKKLNKLFIELANGEDSYLIFEVSKQDLYDITVGDKAVRDLLLDGRKVDTIKYFLGSHIVLLLENHFEDKQEYLDDENLSKWKIESIFSIERQIQDYAEFTTENDLKVVEFFNNHLNYASPRTGIVFIEEDKEGK